MTDVWVKLETSDAVTHLRRGGPLALSTVCVQPLLGHVG